MNTVMTSSPSQLPMQHASPSSLRGISPSYQAPVDFNPSNSKGAYVTASSPYDASPGSRSQTSAMMGDGRDLHNDPLLVGSIDSIDNRQVIYIVSFH